MNSGAWPRQCGGASAVRGSIRSAAEAGVRQLEAFYSAIRMPANLREVGIKEEHPDVMAAKAVENGKLGIQTSLGKDKVLQILRAAF